MALYRHVLSKDELVALMVEVAVGRPTVPDDGAAGGATRALANVS